MKTLTIALGLTLFAVLAYTDTDPFGVKYQLSSLAPYQPEPVYANSAATVADFQPAAHATLHWGAEPATDGLPHLAEINAQLAADLAQLEQACRDEVGQPSSRKCPQPSP